MIVNEIAEALNLTINQCRKLMIELKVQGLIKSQSFINKGKGITYVSWPDETLAIVRENMNKPKVDNREVELVYEPPTHNQRMALNLFISGIGLGKKRNAPPGFSGRLMDRINKGEIKEG